MVFQKLKEQNLLFVHEITEQGWGQKSFRVLDPDGYIVEIAEEIGLYTIIFTNAQLITEELAKSLYERKVSLIIKL